MNIIQGIIDGIVQDAMRAYRSRTIRTLAVMFVYNGLASIIPQLGGVWQMVANSLLSVLAAYYKLTPSQQYGAGAAPSEYESK